LQRSVRVGIIGDTHGALDARVLSALAGCDTVVHAGDVGGDEVLAALSRTGASVVAVRGNNDVAGKWLRCGDRNGPDALPESAALELPGGTLAVVHGHRVLPASDRHRKLREQFPRARLVVYGHSHRLCIDRGAVPWLVNPGAAGRARTFGGPSLVVLDAAGERWRLAERRFAGKR